MKKTVLVLVVVFVLGACIPSNLVAPTQLQPVVDVAGTANANLQTSIAQTLASQPTATMPPPTETSVLAPTQSPTAIPTETVTVSALPNLTTTPATATSAPAATTATFTPPSGARTMVPTLTVRLYGTLPPLVPFGSITLINKAKAEAYISLQVTTRQGGPTILEYPVERTEKINAPSGYYLFVAWVGGRKMVGNFILHEDDSLYITLYRDRVVVGNAPSYP